MTGRRTIAGVLVVLLAGLTGYYVYIPFDLPELSANHPDPGWDQGPLVHVLPTVSHDRILLKVSLRKPFSDPPSLLVGERTVRGVRTDTKGSFWRFNAEGLESDHVYRLQLVGPSGQRLTDSWQLETFPSPEARPEHFRLLVFSCAGGHDAHIRWFGVGPLPLKLRKRLLNRALSFNPDAMISLGDQIYYDLQYGKSAAVMGQSRRSIAWAGEFDRDKPVSGTTNERVLKRAVSPQIAYLYGTAARSVPSFFLLDDHDYFENDEATRGTGFDVRLALLAMRSPFYRTGVSFPPDDFMLELGRTAQKLYLPEFLPAPGRPLKDFPATGAPDRAPGVSEAYGTLRYGRLVEALLYETRRFLTLEGEDAVFVHPRAERWLKARMSNTSTRHLVNMPGVPVGWSAGKWLEWYPDVKGEDGELTTARPKYKWQPGWFRQHQRILRAATRMPDRIPLFIAGDLHHQGMGRIRRSGEVSFADDPVISVMTGSFGVGPRMYPSSFRGTKGQPPNALDVEETISPLEKNGFLIVDFTPETITIRFFAWRSPQPVSAIDELTPHHVVTLRRDT